MNKVLAPGFGTSIMALQTPEEPAVVTKHASSPEMLIRGKFVCSHCGAIIYRTVRASDQTAERPHAYFCNLKCTKQNRLSGLGILNAANRNKMLELHKAAHMPYREIADTLHLSPLAVETFLREQYHPVDTPRRLPNTADMISAAAKKRRPGRKPKVVEEEDDIFSDYLERFK